MIKATVLYGHPADVDAFEKYYHQTHLPLVAKAAGIAKAEYTRFLPNPDGSTPAHYRMAELYFAGPAEMQQTLGSPEGKAMAADLSNFATGGVTILIGQVET
ncbi:MAG: EthD family reductase [Bacteroidetes bacterium]|nr:EthD family reductase [Bacteroidota bacterium]MCW5895555.1 EthD family reductase [Bacteroidota bacterium]